MKPIPTLAACTALALNGCTLFFWGHNDPFSETRTYREIARDDIQAFGVVKQANSQLAPGSLVMMGKNHWFVVNPEDSAKLQGVLNVKLDKAFQIVASGSHRPLAAFPVTLQSADSNAFISSFCLRYDTDRAAEIAKLKALSFSEIKTGKQAPYYLHCDSASGHFYQTPADYRADYRFETPFPVTVGYTVTQSNTHWGKLAENILFTPVTLAIDAAVAVTGIALSPLFLLGNLSK